MDLGKPLAVPSRIAGTGSCLCLVHRLLAETRHQTCSRVDCSHAVAAGAVALFGPQQKLGLETIGSKFGPGAIPLGLPPFQMPDISLERIRSLMNQRRQSRCLEPSSPCFPRWWRMGFRAT